MTPSQPTGGLVPKTQFVLRFPDPGVRKDLKVRAAKNERSLNAEILFLIKRGLAAEQQGQGAAA